MQTHVDGCEVVPRWPMFVAVYVDLLERCKAKEPVASVSGGQYSLVGERIVDTYICKDGRHTEQQVEDVVVDGSASATCLQLLTQ